VPPDRIERSIIHLDARSSYFTWVAILVLIVVSQLFGFFEKVGSFAVLQHRLTHQFSLQFWLKVWGEVGSLPRYHQRSNFCNHQAYNTVVSGVSDLFHSEDQQLVFQDISSPPPYIPYIHALLVNPKLLDTESFTFPSVYHRPLFYVLIYAAIGLAGVVITTINTVVQYHGAIRASKSLFTRLLNTLVRATMRWHDITPTGNAPFALLRFN